MTRNSLQPLHAAIKQVLRQANAVRPKSAVSVIAALAFSATALSPQVSAADYSASNETELRDAIDDANADADASGTITLTSNIALSSPAAFSAATKPITINVNGFTLSGLDQPSGTADGGTVTFSNVTLSNSGNIRGGNAFSTTGANGVGGVGLILSNGSLINNGSITGGTGGDNSGILTSTGGRGAQLTGGNHINNGTITGGTGGSTVSGLRNGGGGVTLSGGSLTNRGTIQAGASTGGGNSAPAFISQGTSTLNNEGTIRGGVGSPAPGNNLAVSAIGTATINNTGTIEAGSGGRAIQVIPFGTGNLTLTNSGTIRSGGPGAEAIVFSPLAASTSILELQPGSVIEGNVVASAANLNDVLRLGGVGTAAFDTSSIGGSAQYRDFSVFQKSGASNWTLTGATSTVTPWQLKGGTLSVSSDTNLGGAAGGLTFDGGTLRNSGALTSSRAVTLNAGGGTLQTDADLTFAGAINGTGALRKTGNAKLTLTGASGYSGGTTISDGTLSIASTAALGTTLSAVTFDGGTLQITGSYNSSRNMTFDAGGGTIQTDVDVTSGGVFSGSGAFTKSGAGKLILLSSFSVAGGATIADGTVQIGNGGGLGSLAGPVVNNGALVFNKNSAMTFGGLISGSGTVTQTRNLLTLTGNNTYTGATHVNAGTLRINGNQSAATGLVSVANGAMLGGSGIIGGAVTVADGGHLAPGNSPGTLTMGSLTLSAGSLLDFELGEANVAGGTFNDLINVNGDLTLDGTLNVTPSAGGTYGAGIYRLINYTGTLTDNGLDLGLMPAGSSNLLQTSMANQVNLINTQGLALGYWDGAADARNNGQIGGGAGIWRAAGNDNWTTSDGSINAPYQGGSMAVFTGTGGTVTVDNSAGAIRVAGLQFASDGYRVEGDAITLSTGANSIRVGDGTDAGAGYSAILASALIGDGTLQKTDLGTLVLTGANTYTGGTTISAGTLQLGEGGTSGSLTGDVTNNGTLAFNRAAALTFGGVISGNGVLRQSGAGTSTLTGAGSNVGALDIQHGTMEVASGASLSAITTTIAAGATLLNGGAFTGTVDDNALTLNGALIGHVDLLDGNDRVQIAEGADFSRATFEGGAGTDTLDLTYSGALTLPQTLGTGFEHLVKHGAGPLTLTGTVGDFSDSITITAGTVQLSDANIITNELRIESGVTVSGVGSLSGNFTNAGVLSPGNSPGTIHVAGNYTQGASGTLISEITRDGTDLLDVSGTATLAGAHRIEVEYGLYLDGTTHTLIEADGGISGDFDSVQINPSALMTSERALSANALSVSFTRRAFTTVADPATGRSRYAEWLEEQISAGNTGSGLLAYIDTLLQQPTAEGVNSLLRQQSEPVAAISQNSVSILGAGFARTVFDRFTVGETAQCTPANGASDAVNCAWAHGLRQWGDADGDAFGSAYDWTAEGGQIGVDRELSPAWSVGATFGYADSDIRDVNDGRNELRSRLGGLYANYAAGPLSVGAMVFYSGNENRTSRNVTIGAATQRASAEFDTDSYGIGARFGYRLTSEAGPLVRPFIETFYDRTEGSRVTERNAGAGNLAAHVHDRDGLRGTLGLQLAQSFDAYGREFRPALEVGVVRQLGDVRSTLDLQPAGSTQAFRTYGSALDRTAYVGRASLEVLLGVNAVLSLGYGGEIADDYSQHEGNLSFRLAW